MGHRAAHPPSFQRGAARESGRALSRASPAGATRVDCSEVGRIRKQPACEILFPDKIRKKVSSKRAGQLGAAFRGDWLGVEDGVKVEGEHALAAKHFSSVPQLVPEERSGARA